MNTTKQPGGNQEKMNFLLMVLNENKAQANKDHPIYYTISLVRFGAKVPVAYREPSSTDIKVQIEKYSARSSFDPDQIIVELFTGKSHNVKKPFAVYRLDFKGKT